MNGWEALVIEGEPAGLVDHTALLAGPAAERRTGRIAVSCRVSRPALVLGSTQPRGDADEAACVRLGAAVVRRASGGGAVFVSPGAQAWVDVFLPAGDPLLEADVSRSFRWFGAAWAAALATTAAPPGSDIGVADPARGRNVWSRRLCFAAVGAGEVTVSGRKVVGISQRRDRDGAWFHSMALLRDTARELLCCLALTPAEREEAAAVLRSGTATLHVDEAVLTGAVVAALPTR